MHRRKRRARRPAFRARRLAAFRVHRLATLRVRRLAAVAAAALVALVLPAPPALAAPTRYEAESATIVQGVVESNHAGFSGTGFVNYNNVTGSAVQWSVTVPNAGAATLAIRFANGSTANRPMEIAVNGTVVAAAQAFNPTGAWTTWQTVTITANLNAGPNTVRATATGAAGGPNVDFLDVDATSAGTDFQAENATIVQGVVESNHAGFTGTGFVNYNNVVGSYVEWSVSAPADGGVSLAIRFANGSTANRPMEIAVNGTVVAAAQAFNPTGAWTTWQTATLNAPLRAGNNLIRATATTANGGPNVDKLTVSLPVDTERPTAPGQPSCSDIGETTLTLSWGASIDNVGVVVYDIYHDGTKIDEAPGNTTSKNLTGLQANFTYRLSVFARDAAGNVSETSPLVTCRTNPIVDPEPPTAPTNLVHSNVTQNSVNLTWGASTDNRGVTAYLVRDAANAVLHTVTGNPPATSTTVPNLACNTSYTLHVVARDAAGNISGPSNTRTFTTPACGRGQPQTPTNVSTNWSIPWAISWFPDGQSALITERDSFRVFRLTLNGQKTQVGSVPNSVTTDGEGGLMGVAVSPTWNGTSDQEVFFMHTSNDGGATQNRIVKMNFNGTTLSGRQVIVSGIRSSRFHNGGRIAFGPDGFLYATTGDSQQQNLAQDPNSLNGKILRITKTGAPAPGNPSGTRVYSLGHRNPQGLAWDSANRLWESELMNDANDELNLIVAGGNYGWPMCQGPCGRPGLIDPKRTWSVAQASPSGIAIVNDTVYMAALRGQRLWRIELNGENVGAVSNHFVGTFGRLRAVSKVPGAQAIWISTTNADNNGGQPDGSDRILRSEIR